MPRRRARQLGLRFHRRGGAREGAGRKPNGAKAGVSHLQRPQFERLLPVHVTLRMARHVYNLRSMRAFSRVGRAIAKAADRFDVAHRSVRGRGEPHPPHRRGAGRACAVTRHAGLFDPRREGPQRDDAQARPRPRRPVSRAGASDADRDPPRRRVRAEQPPQARHAMGRAARGDVCGRVRVRRRRHRVAPSARAGSCDHGYNCVMHRLRFALCVALMAMLGCVRTPPARNATAAQANECKTAPPLSAALADRVVAVVGTRPILLSELNDRVRVQPDEAPDHVLDAMVDDELIRQQAERLHVAVADRACAAAWKPRAARP